MAKITSEQWDELYDKFYETAQDTDVDGKYNILCELECGEYLMALDVLIGVNGDNDQTYDDFCDYIYGMDFASWYANEMMNQVEVNN